MGSWTPAPRACTAPEAPGLAQELERDLALHARPQRSPKPRPRTASGRSSTCSPPLAGPRQDATRRGGTARRTPGGGCWKWGRTRRWDARFSVRTFMCTMPHDTPNSEAGHFGEELDNLLHRGSPTKGRLVMRVNPKIMEACDHAVGTDDVILERSVAPSGTDSGHCHGVHPRARRPPFRCPRCCPDSPLDHHDRRRHHNGQRLATARVVLEIAAADYPMTGEEK